MTDIFPTYDRVRKEREELEERLADKSNWTRKTGSLKDGTPIEEAIDVKAEAAARAKLKALKEREQELRKKVDPLTTAFTDVYHEIQKKAKKDGTAR